MACVLPLPTTSSFELGCCHLSLSSRGLARSWSSGMGRYEHYPRRGGAKLAAPGCHPGAANEQSATKKGIVCQSPGTVESPTTSRSSDLCFKDLGLVASRVREGRPWPAPGVACPGP